MLTAKQQQLLSYIKLHLDKGGVSPSFEEMKEALDLKSKSGIHRLISALEERGFIRRLPNRARALEIVKLPDGMAPAALRPAPSADAVPLRKPAPAVPARATPIAANDVIEIPLHGRIAAGDYALIQRTETARAGQIVVALIDEAEATLKYFQPEGRKVRLDPANRDYEPQVYDAGQVRIQGRLAGLLRRYN
jgi:repressor LexA